MRSENETKMPSIKRRGGGIHKVPEIQGEGPTGISWAEQIMEDEKRRGIDPIRDLIRGGEQHERKT